MEAILYAVGAALFVVLLFFPGRQVAEVVDFDYDDE